MHRQSNHTTTTKMKRDFFTNLPSEITINILSRLPLGGIAMSKCVCKPWLHLLATDDFIKSHLAKSTPALAVLTSSSCTVFEFEDHQNLDRHDLHYNPLIKFDLPHAAGIQDSANGLLFLSMSEAHYVCNPITRQYAELHYPREIIRSFPKVVNYPEILSGSLHSYPQSVTYGFGASRITGQHKVVQIYHDSVIVDGGIRTIPESECHVHTLGTGTWRRVKPGALLEYSPRSSCVFLNGNLHWVASDSDDRLWISCFDLETERFSSFSTPPLHQGSFELIPGLSTLGGRLCLCDHTREVETVIWAMKEYGVEESWTREYVINLNEDDLDIEGFELVYPIKVFQDADILMLRENGQLFYYSTNTGTAKDIGIFDVDSFVTAILLTPSFLSLKSLGMKSVVSF
ncbi:F-box protein At3g07870-like [Salvia miltiorrhiza]|uniref:F-box protein At3g07870-like n=1 Tax=Salvia miltiorrhiza TaxID=226208 RepID=UPI0025AD43F4|nr:F-box protein At3g07870-like [Salvia miltiorrhiza]